MRQVPLQHARRDWWPLTRLALLLVVLGTQAHLMSDGLISWEAIVALPGRLIPTFVMLAFVSCPLACLYAMLWFLPLILLVYLDDGLYACSRRVFSTIFRLQSGMVLKGLSFGGELAAFTTGFYYLYRYFPSF